MNEAPLLMSSSIHKNGRMSSDIIKIVKKKENFDLYSTVNLT